MAGIDNKKEGQALGKNNLTNDKQGSKVDIVVPILTVSVFFDGTRNNRHNTEAARTTPSFRVKDISYDNYYSNVALLFMAMKPTTVHKKVYIEGAGTTKGKTDDGLGLGMAIGDTGVSARVQEACKEVEAIRKKINPTFLLVNIYGFSRGAAYGRHFCSYLKGSAIHDGLGFSGKNLKLLNGIDMHPNNIMINFMGLFDTVSSFGTMHYSNVSEYNLDIGKERYHIGRIVHLIAQNDYRNHFPLTKIKAAVHDKIGFECSFPGAHSDIGGGYAEKSTETKWLGYRKMGEGNRDHLFISYEWFKKAGYYTDKQITFKENVYKIRNQTYDKTTVHAERETSYHYQFITAEIMWDIMKKETFVTPYSDAKLLADIPKMKAITVLKAFRDKAHTYVINNYKTAGANFKVPLLDEAQMKEIYNKYIHNSLTYEQEPTSFSPNEGTTDNKKKKADGSFDYMNPTRPLVTKGFKYK